MSSGGRTARETLFGAGDLTRAAARQRRGGKPSAVHSHKQNRAGVSPGNAALWRRLALSLRCLDRSELPQQLPTSPRTHAPNAVGAEAGHHLGRERSPVLIWSVNIRTEPSPISPLTPPSWLLDGVKMPHSHQSSVGTQLGALGGRTVVKAVNTGRPSHHRWPLKGRGRCRRAGPDAPWLQSNGSDCPGESASTPVPPILPRSRAMPVLDAHVLALVATNRSENMIVLFVPSSRSSKLVWFMKPKQPRTDGEIWFPQIVSPRLIT